MLHGVNPLSSVLLKVLDIDQPNGKWKSGRFRDIYINESGDEIIIYTRNGGGNREHYDEDIKEGDDCDCTGCTITYHLPKHPNYLKDEDDDFDCTYAYVTFSVPKEFSEIVKNFSTGESPMTVAQKFELTMKDMEKMSKEELRSDKRFSPIVAILDEIFEKK